jgi:hypothetical protein
MAAVLWLAVAARLQAFGSGGRRRRGARDPAPSQRESSTVRVQEKISSAIWPQVRRMRIRAAPAGRVPGG